MAKPYLIVTSEKVSKEYLDYLDRQNISWIACVKEQSALMGRMPSAVGYQPTLANELGALQERITSTKEGSITSVQACTKRKMLSMNSSTSLWAVSYTHLLHASLPCTRSSQLAARILAQEILEVDHGCLLYTSQSHPELPVMRKISRKISTTFCHSSGSCCRAALFRDRASSRCV